jgi:cytochrome c-type biogenesis protein CcmH
MRAFIAILFLMIFTGFIVPAFGQVTDPDKLENKILEAKSIEIMKKLRCLVCQNQSIVDSDADHARDLRNIVRERVKAGDSDAEVTAYMTSRYGDWVLLEPPFSMLTAALWLSPLILLIFGIFLIVTYQRKMKENRAVKESGAQELSRAELDRLDEILKRASSEEIEDK